MALKCAKIVQIVYVFSKMHSQMQTPFLDHTVELLLQWQVVWLWVMLINCGWMDQVGFWCE